jgi:hypothetical protein
MSQVLDAPEFMSDDRISFAISTSTSSPISLDTWPSKTRMLGMLFRAAISMYAGYGGRYVAPPQSPWQQPEMLLDYLSRTDPYFYIKVMSG